MYSSFQRATTRGDDQTVQIHKLVCDLVVHMHQSGFLCQLCKGNAKALMPNLNSNAKANIIRVHSDFCLISPMVS